jgi:hypothetical protein
MSGEGLFLLAIIFVVAGSVIYYLIWQAVAVARLRRTAERAEPAIVRLEQTVASFRERFPYTEGQRLPLAPDEYPVARPRRRSRPTSGGRRSSYRRRYR